MPSTLRTAQPASAARNVALLIGLTLCAGSASAGTPDPNTLALQVVSQDVIERPLYVTHAPGDESRIFVLSQRGMVWIFKHGQMLPVPFLDIEDLALCCGESGLLGLAFHPDYDNNGYFYINYTDLDGNTVIARGQASDNPDVADPQLDPVLSYIQFDYNHNGGWMEFGPDGYLYIATGDGGGRYDPQNNAQDITGNLLGKILRIDIDGDDFPMDDTRNYAIPLGNPFTAREGDDEIWLYGLRNPWRCSFDRQTGDLVIADVGQDDFEEINIKPAGEPGGTNYGWRCQEGLTCLDFSECTCPNNAFQDPIYVYQHGGVPFRCSITGGEVYRGCELEGFSGAYFFADYCSSQVWALFRDEGGGDPTIIELTAALTAGPGLDPDGITSFGRDARGEIYICDRFNGGVYRVVSSSAPAIVSSDPPSGSIDARRPTDPTTKQPTGWNELTLTFNGPTDCVSPGAFSTTQSGTPGEPPNVTQVSATSANEVRLTLDRPITPGAWTKIAHPASATEIRLGYLPADVNGDRTSAAPDIVALIDAINGVGSPRPIWSTDIDRNGATGPPDIITLIDLLNGASGFDPWLARTLPE